MIAVHLRVLLHHDGIRAARHGAPVSMLHALASPNRPVECHARAAFADQAQLRARLRRIGGAHRKTVANRAIEGRIIAVGGNIFGEDAAQSDRRIVRESIVSRLQAGPCARERLRLLLRALLLRKACS